jgi:hypothetical protein
VVEGVRKESKHSSAQSARSDCTESPGLHLAPCTTILLSGILEEQALGHFYSSTDLELACRCPVNPGPGKHVWGHMLLVAGTLACSHPHLPPTLVKMDNVPVPASCH